MTLSVGGHQVSLDLAIAHVAIVIGVDVVAAVALPALVVSRRHGSSSDSSA